ncbi:outer membrane beta-barrel protein [Flavihumibacter solisilvae]|uniref:Outer membrane protein beta-barrel domain-containing protein n=1 Tax=Flavihumibacter solisilvae TaxID=1349421 RepID=A0A0C1IQB5_9BACT|nr:outer membrane beta-barrel protein [Flavihumibacter solisilvae]KIC92659.1 hypothetical protein OI18_21620 [Flavihumibacter solisilvae]
MRILLLVCFVLSLNVSFAQLEKRTWLLGGDATYSRSESSSDGTVFSKGNSLQVGLNNGYFFWDKLALGGRVSLLNSVEKYPLNDNRPEGKLRQTNWSFGPFVRYYFLPAQKRINIFADAGGMYSIWTNNSTDHVSKAWSATAAAGPAIFLNQNIALELMLAYVHYSGVGYDYKSNSLQFKAGFQIHFKKSKQG